MPHQEIIAVGASAGGVEALKVLVAGLPGDLNAAVMVVLHIGEGINGQSHLPDILAKAGRLPVGTPFDGEEIRLGRVYIAPPDYHLHVKPGRLCLVHGPKENHTRPAINPLFRSAAAAYGSRVTGVLLTGMLDDGVAGLAEIKRRGGLAVVQDPATALFTSMPRNAIQRVDVDYISSLEDMGDLLYRFTRMERSAVERDERIERSRIEVTCPECRGPLWEERQGRIVEYRCRVGHTYSPLGMAHQHDDTVERSLWASVVALEEAADIAEKLEPELGADAAQSARTKRARASVLREMLSETAPR